MQLYAYSQSFNETLGLVLDDVTHQKVSNQGEVVRTAVGLPTRPPRGQTR